ncbi:TIGR00725 family protein [Haloferax sp. MBLA0076]|uniref:TIGR00725 family protein n=1 Tax=Haloferax litoreum TaxID=2666140 RepID=A0A6A8GLZ6_9EURY|nr:MULTISPECIES: TIGR00725 family protein [Haloferax]KAB1194162.1 TIGR00725 family protein [Haloferax sp. CBA1148]MRX22720.1 TIGR00725 family protein [Haloferax litoreum]
MRVSVVGGSVVPDPVDELAEDVGRLLAQRGHTVVCGGLGGVMEAACRGAKDAGGTTIGILPGEERDEANEYVDVSIVTGLRHARNALVVMNGDAVIAIDGAGGTLSEIGFGAVYDRPVAGIRTHNLGALDRFRACKTPEAAVTYVEDES